MSDRNRFLDTAIRVALIGLVLVIGAGSVGLLSQNPPTYPGIYVEGGKQAEHAQFPGARRTPIESEACAEAAQATNQNGAAKDRRDLCAQYRSAIAAERSANYSRFQTIIGVIGIIGVLITLWLNYAATDAAAEAAKAARESVAVAQAEFRETGRPEIEPILLSHGFNEALNDATGATQPYVIVRLLNIGGRTAILQDTAVWLHFGDGAPDPSPEAAPFPISHSRSIDVRPEGHHAAVSAGAGEWSDDLRRKLWRHETQAFAIGYVPYTDKRGFEWERDSFSRSISS